MRIRQVINLFLTAWALISSSAHASCDKWLAKYPRKILVQLTQDLAHDVFADEILRTREFLQKSGGFDPVAYTERLVNDYRQRGGRLYWISRRANELPESRYYDEWLRYQVHLRLLGAEMRQMMDLPGLGTREKFKIAAAFEDYADLERATGVPGRRCGQDRFAFAGSCEVAGE